jgi:hypothetical protein
LDVKEIRGFLETGTSLGDFLVEKSNADDEIGKLNKLGDFLRGIEGNKGPEGSSGDDAFQGGCNLFFNLELVLFVELSVGDLLIFIDEEVEYFFVEMSESLKIFGILDLKVDDIVNMLSRVDGFVLGLSLFFKLGFQELSIIGCDNERGY